MHLNLEFNSFQNEQFWRLIPLGFYHLIFLRGINNKSTVIFSFGIFLSCILRYLCEFSDLTAELLIKSAGQHIRA
jgi:hypothetical protein